MKKWMKVLIGIGAIGVLALSSGFLKKSLEVEVVEIEPKSVLDHFTEDGVVKSGENINIISLATGKVREVYVDKNAYVKQGTVIAKIDPIDYEYEKKSRQNNITSYKAKGDEAIHNEKNEKDQIAFSIEQLNEALKSLESKGKSSQINNVVNASPEEYIEVLALSLELSQSEYDYNKTNYDNLKSLFEIQAVSKTQLDEAENTLVKARTVLTKAKTQLEKIKGELEKLKADGIDEKTLDTYFYKYQNEDLEATISSAHIQINALKQKLATDYSTDAVKQINALIDNENVAIKQLEAKIADCSITAKTSGYIIDLPIKNQSIVNALECVATIKAEDLFTIEVKVLTSLEPYLTIGDEVTMTQKLRSEDVLIKGKIKEIYNFATKEVSALGLEEHRVTVIIEMADEKIVLKDGYELEVSFTTFKEDNQIVVPNSALFEIDDKDYVFKLEGKKAVLTTVETTYKTNTETVVVAGINKGDKVVYNANTEGLLDGVEVSAKNK